MLGKPREKPLARILMPIAGSADKELMVKALYALSAFKDPEIVLFHVVEMPSRTVPIEVASHREEIASAEHILSPTDKWLRNQGYSVTKKVVVARDVAEAIVGEGDAGNYVFIIMTKRRPEKGIRRIFHRSVSEKVIRESKCMVLTTLAARSDSARTQPLEMIYRSPKW